MFISEEYEPHPLWTAVGRYGVAVLVVCLAAGLTRLLAPVAEGIPFLFFFVAVMVSAWYGGFRPALVTILLGALWSAYFVLPPVHSLWGESAHGGAATEPLRADLFSDECPLRAPAARNHDGAPPGQVPACHAREYRRCGNRERCPGEGGGDESRRAAPDGMELRCGAGKRLG